MHPMAFWKKFRPLCFCGGNCDPSCNINPGCRAQTLLAVFSPASNHRTGVFKDFAVVLTARENPAGLQALEISALKVSTELLQPAASAPCRSCPAALPRTAGSSAAMAARSSSQKWVYAAWQGQGTWVWGNTALSDMQLISFPWQESAPAHGRAVIPSPHVKVRGNDLALQPIWMPKE